MQRRLPNMLLALSIYGLAVCGITLAARLAHADSADAALRFESGVRAFEEHRLADAASEFERSYEIQPAFPVLYNLGTVYSALGRPVEAIAAFERYLTQGGSAVPNDRRTEVQRELARQRAKLAQLEITASEPGAEVQLDAKIVGRAPLHKTLMVASGRHVVEVSLAGFHPQRSELDVLPGQVVRISPTLMPAQVIESPSLHAALPRVGLGQRVAGYVLGGAGLGTTVAGIVLYANGQTQHLDALDKAKAGDRPAAERLESDAEHKKVIGSTVASIGAAALLGCLVLLVSAPDAAAPLASARISPWTAASAGGLIIEGRWL